MTYLKAISTRVLEKNGVVTGFPGLGNFMSGSFNVPCSRTNGNLSQPIHLAGTVRPKRDAALVGHMLRRLGNAEELRDAVSADRLKLQPSLDPDVVSETKRRQERLIERSRLGNAAHSEVNVIVASPHLCYASGMRLLFWASHASKVCNEGLRDREPSRLRAPQKT